MNTNKKVILLVTLTIFLMFIFMIFNFIYNFRDYGIKSIENKASILAKTVEHTLTSQMQTGVIDKRKIFLDRIENLPNIHEIWLARGQKVIDMYGEGTNEHPRDRIDELVLKTGIEQKVIKERMFTNSTYRITIPYKATSEGTINCISCHTNAKEGDTLGAITIVFPIDDSKQTGINTIVHTSVIGFILILVIGFLLNYLISPFLTLFVAIKYVMNKAQKGDYSKRIDDIENKEAKEVSLWINGLLEKLETTLGKIDSNISIFLSNKSKIDEDPLINVENTVKQLSDVYKFRKTIENDNTADEIYTRLASVLKRELNIKNLNMLEANTNTGEIHEVFISFDVYCDVEQGCRADRTNQIVDSTQFQNVCTSCNVKKLNHICIPYALSNETDLVISIFDNSKEEIKRIRENISIIDNYIDVSKTVIVSKNLMNILEQNAQTDPLTKLYNRKYLDEQVNKVIDQAKRANVKFGILMLDIDHFKMINDTYGHDVGDTAIKLVAKTLIDNTRTSDICIRYGGEEFIILLHNCDEDNIFKVAEKIRIAFSQVDIPIGNGTINKTLSVGASMYPKDSSDINACIKNADLALYEAKNTGRNKVVLFSKDSN